MFFAIMALVLLLLLLLDVAAIRWGTDSRDTINSSEWTHRHKFWMS